MLVSVHVTSLCERKAHRLQSTSVRSVLQHLRDEREGIVKIVSWELLGCKAALYRSLPLAPECDRWPGGNKLFAAIVICELQICRTRLDTFQGCPRKLLHRPAQVMLGSQEVRVRGEHAGKNLELCLVRFRTSQRPSIARKMSPRPRCTQVSHRSLLLCERLLGRRL